MLKLAEIKPSDTFYDLGCGDASLLILAVKEFNAKEAIGIESRLYRRFPYLSLCLCGRICHYGF
jgi:precorrin-6B methylase 2